MPPRLCRVLPRLRGGEMPPSPGFAGYSPDCAGESLPPPPASPGTPPTARWRVLPPSPGFAGYSPGCAGESLSVARVRLLDEPDMAREQPLWQCLWGEEPRLQHLAIVELERAAGQPGREHDLDAQPVSADHLQQPHVLDPIAGLLTQLARQRLGQDLSPVCVAAGQAPGAFRPEAVPKQ